jgi:hypothetical protein
MLPGTSLLLSVLGGATATDGAASLSAGRRPESDERPLRRDEVVVLEGHTQQPTFAFEAPLQDVSVHGFDADRNPRFVFAAGGAAVLLRARDAIGVVIFLAGIVALFIALGDWLRARRPNVD